MAEARKMEMRVVCRNAGQIILNIRNFFEEAASNIPENHTAVVGSDSERIITDLGDSNYTASECSDSERTATDISDSE